MKKIAIISTVLMFALISLSLFLTHLNIMSGSKNTIDYYRAYEISKDEYTLHTYIDDLNKVSFYITDDTNALIYKCEKSWRASDLKTIDFDSNTYDVLIVSGDIGTVRYVYCDETWIEKHETGDGSVSFLKIGLFCHDMLQSGQFLLNKLPSFHQDTEPSETTEKVGKR